MEIHGRTEKKQKKKSLQVSPKKQKSKTKVTEGAGLYPHKPSQIGSRYNVYVPPFIKKNDSEDLDNILFHQEDNNPFKIDYVHQKEQCVFIPGRICDKRLDKYLSECLEDGLSNEDLNLYMLHLCNYDPKTALNSLQNYKYPEVHPFYESISHQFPKYSYIVYDEVKCPCSCHTLPPRIEIENNHEYKPFSFDWGYNKMKTLGINTTFLTDYFDKKFDDEVCGYCLKPGDLLICDGPCHHSYHLHCLRLNSIPETEYYYCPYCVYILASQKTEMSCDSYASSNLADMKDIIHKKRNVSSFEHVFIRRISQLIKEDKLKGNMKIL
ncbi:hypothetical protein WA158_005923 [Blastocystis sp. Blastoise]